MSAHKGSPVELDFCSGCGARLGESSCARCGSWGSRGEYTGPERETHEYVPASHLTEVERERDELREALLSGELATTLLDALGEAYNMNPPPHWNRAAQQSYREARNALVDARARSLPHGRRS